VLLRELDVYRSVAQSEKTSGLSTGIFNLPPTTVTQSTGPIEPPRTNMTRVGRQPLTTRSMNAVVDKPPRSVESRMEKPTQMTVAELSR